MEHKFDCTDWNREHLSEILTIFSQCTNGKIILCWEEDNTDTETAKGKMIGKHLNNLGIPCHLKGYGFLKYSIVRSLSHPEELESVTKLLYPAVAKKFNTSSGRVEHGIRNAIQKAYESGGKKEWENIFGKNYSCRNYKPTNLQFIATLTDHINMYSTYDGNN